MQFFLSIELLSTEVFAVQTKDETAARVFGGSDFNEARIHRKNITGVTSSLKKKKKKKKTKKEEKIILFEKLSRR